MNTELGHAIGMQDGPGYFLTHPVMATQLDNRVVNWLRKCFHAMYCMYGKYVNIWWHMMTYVVNWALDQKCYISIVDLFVRKPEPDAAIEMRVGTGCHLTTLNAPGIRDTRVMVKPRPTCPKCHSILQLSNPILTHNKGFCPVFANRTLNQVDSDRHDSQYCFDF